LRRFAVFAGGWTLASAESIAAGGDVAQSKVLDLQSQLVDKSLVAMDAEGGRYRLLDTVRDYARERLDSSSEGPALRRRHLDHFVAFAEAACTHLSGLEEAIWLARLDAERENLLTAHAWGDHSGAPDTGLRLASALKPYLFNRGMLGLAYRITAESLARIPGQDQSAERCRSLFDAGQICYFMGRYGDAGRYLQESLAVARALGDSRSIARTLQPLGLSYVGQGNLAAARVHLEEALTLARSQGDKRQVAAALNALGQLRRVEGALHESEPMYAQALALAHEIGDRETTAIGLLNLAMVDVERGTTESARRRLVDVLRISDEIGSKPAGQSVVEVCAGMAALQGDWLRAARFFGAAEKQTSYTGISRDPADDAYLRPLIERARRTSGDDAFASAEQAGRALTYEDVIAEARDWLTAQT
jgi:non-specific serine/threonine protein kinase